MTGKKYLSVIIFLFAIANAKAQTLPSDCLCTDQLIKIYRNDASRMAYRRIFELQSPYRDSVKIHTPTADSILAKIALVHNMPASPLRDSVFWVFGSQFYSGYYYPFGEDSAHVHGAIPSLRKFTLLAHETEPWVAQWLAGNFTGTINTQLNQLMATYRLTAQGYSQPVNGNRIFTVFSSVNYNTTALSNLFNAVPGVVSTEPVFPVGDGCNIQYRRTADTTFLDFEHKCSDCLAGCQGTRTFSFKITGNSCAVQYLGSSISGFTWVFGNILDCFIIPPSGGLGTPPAGYLPCTIAPQAITALPNMRVTNRIQNSDFVLLPNPVYNRLTIIFPPGIKKQKQLRIMDVQGRQLQEFNINNTDNRFLVNTAALLPGLYYITVSTYAGMNTFLFSKQ